MFSGPQKFSIEASCLIKKLKYVHIHGSRDKSF